MRLEPPFRAAGEHIVTELPGATALFSTRRGGVSDGPFASLNLGLRAGSASLGDDPQRVDANRDRLCAAAGIERARVVHARQVHGTTVQRVARPPRSGWSVAPEAAARAPEADAHATALAGVACVVLTADCLPIALASPAAVAIVHGGWRGLAGGIIDAAVAALRELDADAPIAAAIGPGVGGCCYEVGDEVRRVFDGHGADVFEGRNVDLGLVARRQLEAAGVAPVYDVGLCTNCSDASLFFSHRRDGGVTGRQAGVVWRT